MLNKLKNIDFSSLTSFDVKELGEEVLSTFKDNKSLKKVFLC